MAASLVIGFSYLRYYYIPSKVEESILWSVSDLGFKSLSIGEIQNKGGELVISNIALDADSFSTIDKITIKFGLFDYFLNNKAISGVIVDGLNLTADIDKDKKLNIYGISPDINFFEKLQSLKTKNIIIKNGRSDVLTQQWGGILATYEGQITLDNATQFIGNIQSNQGTLSFEAKVNGWVDNGLIKLNAEVHDLFVEYENSTFRRGKGDISFDQNKDYSISIQSTLEYPSGVYRNMPLRDVKIISQDINNKREIKAEGKASGINGLSWDIAINSSNEFSLNIKPKTLQNMINYFEITNVIEEPENIPSLLLDLPITNIAINSNYNENGSITLNTPLLMKPAIGEFKFSNSNILGSLKFNNTSITLLENMGIDLSGVLAFTINTEITPYPVDWNSSTQIENGYLSLIPHIKLSDLSASISHSSKKKSNDNYRLNFELPIKNSIKHSGTLNIKRTDGQKIDVSGLKLNIFKGSVKATTPIINNSNTSKANKLLVADIDIGRLFKSTGFSEIVAWGEMGGVLPIIVNDGNINVKNGILQSQSSGIIRIPSYLISGLFPGSSQRMSKIRATLLNYHYEFFELRMDGLLNERVLITLNSRGYNPDLKSKEPIDINLQIETQISLLFESMLKK